MNSRLGSNDLTFGFTTWHQLQTGTGDDSSGIYPSIPTGYFGEWSYFARDTYTFTKQLSFFLNAWMKHSSVTGRTTFDPARDAAVPADAQRRRAVHLRPFRRRAVAAAQTRRDARRCRIRDRASPTVNCNGFNDVTSAGNPNLQSESANDFEVGIGHRFSGDSNIQLNALRHDGHEPALRRLAAAHAIRPRQRRLRARRLANVSQRLQSQCPGQNITVASLPQYLSVSTTYNAAHALARGIELTGRERINRIAYVDYGYYVESSTKTGISRRDSRSNPTVVNGAQLARHPAASSDALARRRAGAVGIPASTTTTPSSTTVSIARRTGTAMHSLSRTLREGNADHARRHEHLQQRRIRSTG